MGVNKKYLGPIGAALFTFIGSNYKQSNQQYRLNVIIIIIIIVKKNMYYKFTL